MARVSVIGLGKLGLCTAVCFAARGFDVIGVDVSTEIVDAVNDGRAPSYEPRLQELMEMAGTRLRATHDHRRALNESDTTLLIVPTPSEPTGGFSDKCLQEALTHLSKALLDSSKRYHLFSVTSTVSPGTTTTRLIPLIESVSARRLNEDFGICYNPEFIALGSVISDFLKPDLVLIGESDSRAGEELADMYWSVCENTPYVARMSIVSAEIAKIALNSYITMKISFANTLAMICEATPGADVDAITKALGADRRVSPYALKGGLPFGGPCFPRDNRAFAAFAAERHVDAALAKATDEVNRTRAHHLVALVRSQLAATGDRRVAILGLAYKTGTPVIEESPAVLVLDELLRVGGLEITVYDPLAMGPARVRFEDRIMYAPSARACLARAPLCLVMTASEEFCTISEADLFHNPTTLIDCWRALDPARLGEKATYIPLGSAWSRSTRP